MKKLFLILFCFTLVGQAEEFKIHKYETLLKSLKDQETKATEALEKKVLKSKLSILEKYYKELERYFNHHMKGKNLELANKVNVKKEQIFKIFKAAQDANKPKSMVKTKAQDTKMSFLTLAHVKSYSSYNNELKELAVGNLCFKKGGDYLGSETWKDIPKFLQGKHVTFLNHDKDSRDYHAYYRSNKNGYVYMISNSSRRGLEKVGTISTSGGRVFGVYKYYVYDNGYISASCYSTSQETLIVINK